MTEDFINKDLLPQTLACSPIYGGGLILDQEVPFKHVDTAGELDYLYKVDGLKIDFDQYFNKLKISKEKFVEYYGANPVVEVKKDGEEFTGWSLTADDSKNLRIDYSNVSGTATTLNNYNLLRIETGIACRYLCNLSSSMLQPINWLNTVHSLLLLRW